MDPGGRQLEMRRSLALEMLLPLSLRQMGSSKGRKGRLAEGQKGGRKEGTPLLGVCSPCALLLLLQRLVRLLLLLV